MPEILMSDLQCTLSPVNEANVVKDVYKTVSVTIADKGLLLSSSKYLYCAAHCPYQHIVNF